MIKQIFHSTRLTFTALWIVLLILISAAAPLISKWTGLDPEKQAISLRYAPPQWTFWNWDSSMHPPQTPHLLGTDELGRDVLVRLIWGGRVTLMVALIVAFTTTFFGFAIGASAGFFSGRVDRILMHLTDSLLAVPMLPVLIVLSAIHFGPLSGEKQSLFKMVLLLCLFSWMSAARLVRSTVLVIKQQEFIEAAHAIGASNARILRTHVFPGAVHILVIATTLNLGRAILSEASLSFLGLGVQPPMPSWGNMLTHAHESIERAPLLAIAPGLFILSTVLCFNILGDLCNDLFNPLRINAKIKGR